jgi:hypothetical protein
MFGAKGAQRNRIEISSIENENQMNNNIYCYLFFGKKTTQNERTKAK